MAILVSPAESGTYTEFEKPTPTASQPPQFEKTVAADILGAFVKEQFGLTPCFIQGTRDRVSKRSNDARRTVFYNGLDSGSVEEFLAKV
jgi:hypothetical protein